MGTQENPPPTVMFSSCKQETHTTLQGFKSLAKRMRKDYEIILNKDDLSLPTLEKADVVLFGCPQENFTPTELQSLKTYVNKGGSLFFLSKEGGDSKQGANGNDLLQEYGITVKGNCLISTIQKHYLHPKEVLVSDCVLCEELNQFVKGEIHTLDGAKLDFPRPHRLGLASLDCQETLTSWDENFAVVYPYGATLALQKPAVAILSSGLMAHPVRQPIGAIWQAGPEHGRVAVLGSVAVFEDSWIEKEDNGKLFDFLMSWLVAKIPIKTDKISMEDLECAELECVPDIGALANRLRCCLQVSSLMG